MSAVFGGIYFLPIYFQPITHQRCESDTEWCLPLAHYSSPAFYGSVLGGYQQVRGRLTTPLREATTLLVTKTGYVIPLAVFSTVFFLPWEAAYVPYYNPEVLPESGQDFMP
jgi:hypothetical protein